MPASKNHAANIMSKTALLVLSLALTGVSWADDSDPAGRVARLSLVQGQVSIAPAGLDEWAAADSNRPVTSGDKIWADADARAEISIGSAVVRLASATGFSFLNLDEHGAQMQVSAGTVSVHVRSMSDTLELDTPNVAVALLGPGDYRVEVNDAGDTTAVKVSGGTAEVTGGGQDFAVHPQQLATFTGTDEVSEDVASLGAPDAFDRWAYARDRQAQEAQAWSYVSPDVVGAEDLDQNGTWESTPDDGSVWAPNTVAVGWAPYRFGHWVWVAPWGWSWVDDAPWGFAPFHYGRWTTFGGRWCWVPGPRRGNAVYAPALVAWVGGGPLSASASFAATGGVAWFPLGPHEVYVPAYPASPTYVRNINISNTAVSGAAVMDVYNHTAANIHYVNRNAPGAITAVSQSAFTTAQSVAKNAVHLSASESAAASISASAPAITPAAKSLLGAGASGPGIRRPPAVLLNRIVVAKTPPPPAPVPFALQQEAIRANGGRPLARSEVAAMQILAPAAHVRMAAPSAHAEPGSGMARAAGRVNSAPPAIGAAPALRPVNPVRGTNARIPPPVQQSQPAQPSQPQAIIRSDRPPAALGQSATDNHSSAEAAKPAVAGDQELNHRVDRPPAAVRVVPAPPPAYLPPAATPHPAAAPVVVETTPAPKPAPVVHALRPAPVEHSRGNN
jgi:FecR protein